MKAWSAAGALVAAFLPLAPVAGADDTPWVDPRSMVRLHEDGDASPPATLEDAAWLEGAWLGFMPNARVELEFLPPAHGQMPMFLRATNAEGVVFYEVAAIVETEGSLEMRLRHFSPDLVGWEDASGPVVRPLVEVEGRTLYFHRGTFARVGPDAHMSYFLNMDGDEELETLFTLFRRAD